MNETIERYGLGPVFLVVSISPNECGAYRLD